MEEKPKSLKESVASFINKTTKGVQAVKSVPGSPETRSWYEYLWRTEQETPNRLEDAAKFLVTMISVTLTLFLSIGKESFSDFTHTWQIKYAVVLWIFSLIMSFFVLFPHRYRYVDEEPASIKKMHKKIVRKKKFFLRVSLFLYLAALILLSAEFFQLDIMKDILSWYTQMTQ